MTAPIRTSRRSQFGEVGLEPVSMTRTLASRLALPDRVAEEHAPLYAANARAMETAIGALELGFPSLPLRRFAQATDATTLVVGHASEQLLSSIDSESLIDCLTHRSAFRPGTQLKLVREREHLESWEVLTVNHGSYSEGHYRTKASALSSALDDGYTIVLNGVELRDAASNVLAGLFECVFGCTVNINGYLSRRKFTSFGSHWDPHEVVILQLRGHKEWTVERPSALSMDQIAHGDATSGDRCWQGCIGPGDAAYVPRGWGHLACSVDELTFHYTITIPRLNGLDVLEGLLSDLVSDASERSLKGNGLPLLPGGEAIEPLPVGASDVDLAVHRAVARARFSIGRRSTASLRAQISALAGATTAGMLVRCPCPGGWVVAHDPTSRESTHEGSVIAGMAGQLLRIDGRHIETIAEVTDGRVHEIGNSMEPRLLRGLICCGILETVSGSLPWGVASAQY